MDFLKYLALSQPAEHFHLLILLASMSAFVLIPYAGFVLGSSVLSLWFNVRSRKNQDPISLTIAQTLIDEALFSKSGIVFLGIMPGFSIMLIYGQMLQSTPAISVGLATFGFIFLLIGMILLYSYKYTFRVQGILDGYRNLLSGETRRGVNQEIESYRQSNIHAHFRSAWYGVLFLFVAIFLYLAALSLIANPLQWQKMDSIFNLLLSMDVWVKVLWFLAVAMGITGIGVLCFDNWKRDGRISAANRENINFQTITRRLITTSFIVIPILVLISVMSISDAATSGMAYLLPCLVLIAYFISGHFLFQNFQEFQFKTLVVGFIVFLLASELMIINDHVLIHYATRAHAAILASADEKIINNLKQQLGVAPASMSGEDIYNARCSACHMFDKKKIGPPYNDIVPKYYGKKSEMIAFVMNPVKVNPAYPSMPNQGLQSAEADSIVTYLLKIVSSKAPAIDSTSAKP